MKLTPEQKGELRAGVFNNRPDSACPDCGGYHLRACPRIKSQSWLGNGNRTAVEYWPQWDDSEVIYPEDAWEDDVDE